MRWLPLSAEWKYRAVLFLSSFVRFKPRCVIPLVPTVDDDARSPGRPLAGKVRGMEQSA